MEEGVIIIHFDNRETAIENAVPDHVRITTLRGVVVLDAERKELSIEDLL